MTFNRFLDTILAASIPKPGTHKQNESPWLFLDAAHTIFEVGRRRVYEGKLSDVSNSVTDDLSIGSVRVMLEELPKWKVLSEILQEIEQDIYHTSYQKDNSYGATLIMCADQFTAQQLREYLQDDHSRNTDAGSSETDEPTSQGAVILRRKFASYLRWKRALSKVSSSFSHTESDRNGPEQTKTGSGKGKPPPSKRRRMRGSSGYRDGSSKAQNQVASKTTDRDDHIAQVLEDLRQVEQGTTDTPDLMVDVLEDMESYFHLYDFNELVIVHPYDGDMDEHILEEIKPRYIIMYEPDPAFIRRIEVYRSSHSERTVKVYFLYYGGSVEEQRYLSAVRREKDAFTKLIRERGVSRTPTLILVKKLFIGLQYSRTWRLRLIIIKPMIHKSVSYAQSTPELLVEAV